MKHKDLTPQNMNGMVKAECVPLYVGLLIDCKNGDANNQDVIRINHLIIGKWSASALSDIKTQAWKIFDPSTLTNKK